MFRRRCHTHAGPTRGYTNDIFVSRTHMGITIASTLAGFIYGNIALYQTHKEYLRYQSGGGSILNYSTMFQGKINAVDTLITIIPYSFLGMLVGYTYPIAFPVVAIHHYYKWREYEAEAGRANQPIDDNI